MEGIHAVNRSGIGQLNNWSLKRLLEFVISWKLIGIFGKKFFCFEFSDWGVRKNEHTEKTNSVCMWSREWKTVWSKNLVTDTSSQILSL